MDRIRVGAFELIRPLGVGGMGEVWAGQHAESRLPVAVKLVTRLSPRLLATFRREVEAVAALDHPGIVMVYDHGELTEEAAAASRGRFQPGSPWLVMEHASGGTLETVPPPGSWAELLRLVLSILDALAHAHARGVVHRDLKPANVLVCTPPDLRPGLKLADFGLALAMDGREVLAVGAGTPAFMAPEQVLRHWWDMGPWTDLYALGGLAWTLATGQRPFPGEEYREVGRAQVSKALPAFEPRFAVPAELEDWLRALLAKQPQRRPDSAAWCAAELLAMGPAERLGGTQDVAPVSGLFTLVPATGLQTDLADEVPTLHAVDAAVPPLPEPARTVIRGRLPPPADWTSAPALRPFGLTRAGLGLYGVRPAPFEGRREERSALWRLLRDVARTKEPRAAVIRGPGGFGASRLAEWIGRRAVEVGAARLLSVPYGSDAGGLRGIAALAEQVARLRGVAPHYAAARAQAVGIEPEALLALARGEPAQVPGDLGLRLVLREAAGGTAILWLDDAHLDESALSLCRAVLDAGAIRQVPVLVLLSIDDDALLERHSAERAVARLEARDDVHPVVLGPLDDSAMIRLIRRLLPLDPTVEARVVELAQGSPLVATQLIGGWVQSGTMTSGERGFSPAGGVVGDADLESLWEARLAPIVREWSPPERHAVLAAAILGASVDERDWTEVCRTLRLPADPDPVDALVRAGLVRRSEHGFRFSHGLVRMALRKRAEEEGLRKAFESACALVSDDPERTGRHLHAAGRPLEAFPHLVEAIGLRVKADSHGPAHLLHERALACLDEAGVAESDPRRGRLQGQLVAILMSDWRLEDASWQARRLEVLSRRHGWTEDLAFAVTIQGTSAFRLRRLDDAADHFHRLIQMTPEGSARRARALRGLGQVHQARGEYGNSEQFYREYADIAHALNDPFLIASAHNDLGSAAVRLGDRDAALEHFRKGLELCELHGYKDATIGRMNVIGQLFAREQFEEAHRLALICLEESEEQVSALALAGAHAVGLRSSAEVGDWVTFDRVASRLRTVIAAARVREESIAEVAWDAGRACNRFGYPDKARFCLDVARDQYAAMGWDSHVRRVVTEIGDLDPSMGA